MRNNPAGNGYLITRDDGSTFVSAMAPQGMPGGPLDMPPPDMSQQPVAPVTTNPFPVSPEMAAMAAPGPDLRTAGLGGGSPLGDLNAQNLAVDSGGPAPTPNMVATPPVIAVQQSYNTQNVQADTGGPPRQVTLPDVNIGPNTDTPAIDPSRLRGVGGRGLPQQSAGPMQVIKGGERKTGEIQGTTSYGPNQDALEANMKRGQQEQYLGTEAGAAARAQSAAGQAGVMADIPGQLEQMRVNAAAAEQGRQAKIQQDLDRYQQLQASAQRTIDPSRIWRNDSDMDKGMASLAVGLGALAQAWGHGPNVALDIYKTAMQNDIDAQKTAMEQSNKAIEQQHGLLADRMRVFGDERQAVLSAKDAYLEQAKSKVNSIIANAKTDEEKANGQVMLGKLQEESAKNQMDMEKVTHQIHTAVVPDRVVGGQMRPPDDIDPKSVAQLPGGQQYVAFPSEKSADAFKEQTADVASFKSDVQRAKALRDNPESFRPGTDAYGERQNVEKRLQLAAPKVLIGIPRASEFTSEMSSGGLNWFNKAGAYDSLDQAADQKVQSLAHAHQGRRVSVSPYRKTPQSGVTLGYNYQDVNTVPDQSLNTGGAQVGK